MRVTRGRLASATRATAFALAAAVGRTLAAVLPLPQGSSGASGRRRVSTAAEIRPQQAPRGSSPRRSFGLGYRSDAAADRASGRPRVVLEPEGLLTVIAASEVEAFRALSLDGERLVVSRAIFDVTVEERVDDVVAREASAVVVEPSRRSGSPPCLTSLNGSPAGA